MLERSFGEDRTTVFVVILSLRRLAASRTVSICRRPGYVLERLLQLCASHLLSGVSDLSILLLFAIELLLLHESFTDDDSR